MKGLIVTNGYFSNEATRNQNSRLVEEFNKLSVTVDVIKSNDILTKLGDTSPIVYNNNGIILPLEKYDFVIYLNKDRYQAQMLEDAGYVLFNNAKAIVNCDDKMLTYQMLSNVVSVPKTISSPIMYSPEGDDKFLSMVERELGYPMIIKTVYGSMGKGVQKVDNFNKLKEVFTSLRMQPHIYQQVVGTTGEDLRITVIGGKAISCMKRKNDKDFRSNVELGGIGVNFTPTKNQIKLAEISAKTLNLDYAGVDILSDGFTDYVCEVNSNAFFKGTESATGVNVAGKYALHIINKLKNLG